MKEYSKVILESVARLALRVVICLVRALAVEFRWKTTVLCNEKIRCRWRIEDGWRWGGGGGRRREEEEEVK